MLSVASKWPFDCTALLSVTETDHLTLRQLHLAFRSALMWLFFRLGLFQRDIFASGSLPAAIYLPDRSSPHRRDAPDQNREGAAFRGSDTIGEPRRWRESAVLPFQDPSWRVKMVSRAI